MMAQYKTLAFSMIQLIAFEKSSTGVPLCFPPSITPYRLFSNQLAQPFPPLCIRKLKAAIKIIPACRSALYLSGHSLTDCHSTPVQITLSLVKSHSTQAIKDVILSKLRLSSIWKMKTIHNGLLH